MFGLESVMGLPLRWLMRVGFKVWKKVEILVITSEVRLEGMNPKFIIPREILLDWAYHCGSYIRVCVILHVH
ncbi:hypothetical protein NMG60_11007403 [Bertholletia excelsa]